ncbi:MAG TPA: hypothetical protein VD788_10475 [Candidatus Polarisedimenticolaceae bacterium]|nr:hypothetical protein [Candidatus Polarisedimenticolaceae bacterium]
MIAASEASGNGLISGFQAETLLWVWCVVVLLYAIVRSFARAEPDPLRPSGPID